MFLMRKLLGGLVAVSLSGAAVAVNVVATPARPPQSAAAATPAQSAKPEASDTVQVRVLLVPSREAKISSQMEGRVASIPIPEGGNFQKGALLVEFDCEHQLAQQAISNAGVDKAKAVLDSKVELQKHAAVGNVEVTLAKVDLDDATARQKQAQAMVRDCRITAPYSGRVVKKIVNQFENVGAGVPLLEIQEMGRIKVEALLPSRALVWVKPGSVIKIHVDEIDKDVPAVVTGIGSRIDSVSQTIGITAEVREKTSGLLPGMSGSATIKKP